MEKRLTESTRSTKKRQSMFSSAGNIAVNRSFSSGRFVTCSKEDKIIRIWKNGKEEVIGHVENDIPVTNRIIKIK